MLALALGLLHAAMHCDQCSFEEALRPVCMLSSACCLEATARYVYEAKVG